MAAANSEFADVCHRAADMLARVEGYFLDRVLVDTAPTDGSVDIHLRLGPTAPDVVVSLTKVVHASIEHFLEPDAAFVDEIRLKHIAGGHRWPDGLTGLGPRPPGTSDVAWLIIEGPMRVEVVAQTITVAVAQVY
ncbi:hypothetical protein [Streptomyces sp. NPDC096142]|uniref:hypothetical protein n=1 Tax=Streptomyces sp. NPDC096142 TaxID=3366077 RepID=UPI003809AE3B